MGEVIAMGDQALMQMAGQLGYAVGPWMVPEEVAGHADLTAAAGAEDRLIEPGPLLDRFLAVESAGEHSNPRIRETSCRYTGCAIMWHSDR